MYYVRHQKAIFNGSVYYVETVVYVAFTLNETLPVAE